MEKLLQYLQKPPIYPTGMVPQLYAPPSDQKMIHAPSDVQPSNPSGHPHLHAPPMSSGQQPSTVNLSNLYSKHPLYVESLQQPLFSGNGIDQPKNRSDIEAGESLTHSKPIELPMYSKNLMFLEGRHQFGFLTRETVRSSPGDALKRLWKGEDSLIRSMLINSREPQIGKPLLYAATTKDLWDTTQTLYSKRQNASRLYTLRKRVHNCKQGTLDVTTYFNKLSLLWQEMHLCREIVWDTPNDCTQYAKLEEADRVYDFLAGLNPKFDNVCGRILGQRPLPSLMEVCFEVRLEEDRTNAMGVLTTPTIDSAAFSARFSNHDSDKNNGKSIPACKKRSSNEKQNSGRAYISETSPANTSQSTDPTASQTKTPTLGAIAQSGMPQSLALISVDGKNPWILDSGPTDHLTGFSEHLISYALCAGNEKIRIADSSLVPIAGKGQIVSFDGFALQNQPEETEICLPGTLEDKSRWSNRCFTWFGCGGRNQTSQFDLNWANCGGSVKEICTRAGVGKYQQYIHSLEASLQEEMSRHAPLYGAGLEALSMKELETLSRIHEEGLRQIHTLQQRKGSPAGSPLVSPHSLSHSHGLYTSAPPPMAVGMPPSLIPNGSGIHSNGHVNGGAVGPWFNHA
ncbi:TRAF-like family protein [Cucumis melo var. makuwa]|uniref:TRAF-like family protein n=2 Tax=Cucumis melo TaxID=3656 RepID=A0A5D3E711_CUCMM|nr:TRAF-like family protein [Cucumis melo var. makuwa]